MNDEPPDAPAGIDDKALAELLARQDGVVSRAQVLELGGTPNDVRRLLRRRTWAPVFPGVYVDHTGPLTWQQRAWAAVLTAWPAALCDSSALRAAKGKGAKSGRDESAPIHVAIDRRRKVAVDRGRVVVHHLADLDEKVTWTTSPPRVRIEQTVLDRAAAAAEADEFAAVEVIANAVQGRLTTAARLRSVLDGRPRIACREFLGGVLDDVRDGACSVLEQGYLERVERAHGLPSADRQVSDSVNGRLYRDVLYTLFFLVVELDGRLFHDTAEARDRDLDRDLDAAVDRLSTVRIGWGQVFRRSCRTAERVATLLHQRGWEGEMVRCPACGPLRETVPSIRVTG